MLPYSRNNVRGVEGGILAIITARGGSKSIPRKNIVPIAGRPMIEYSIMAAVNSARVDRVIVSTDDQEIADVSARAGAEVPFLRPTELAQDDTPTLPVLRHALIELARRDGYRASGVLLLQPTSPLRTNRHVDESVDMFDRFRPDSVVSVVEVPHNFNPVSLMKLECNTLKPYVHSPDTKILRRQDKPLVYARNGPAILIVSVDTLLVKNDLYGARVLPYVMSKEDSLDIDTAEDLHVAEILLEKR